MFRLRPRIGSAEITSALARNDDIAEAYEKKKGGKTAAGGGRPKSKALKACEDKVKKLEQEKRDLEQVNVRLVEKFKRWSHNASIATRAPLDEDDLERLQAVDVLHERRDGEIRLVRYDRTVLLLVVVVHADNIVVVRARRLSSGCRVDRDVALTRAGAFDLFTGNDLLLEQDEVEAVQATHLLGELLHVDLETLGGTAGSIGGMLMDGTAFGGSTEEQFKEILTKNGFDEHGEEVLYDGLTGKQIRTKIFIGVIYYQRLHHPLYIS